jgi:16S rRNA (cytosine967-C5)-methyltransferase
VDRLPQKQTNAPLKVRHLALEILNRVESPHHTLDRLMEELPASGQLEERRDRALLNALVLGVARWRGRLDFIIGRCSRSPLEKIDPPVLNALRLGVFQIVFLDRVPASAAVNTSVELVKQIAPKWVVRFVNAVLRRVAADWQRIALPALSADPASAIAVRSSFPEWLVQRWIRRYGTEETLRRCDRLNEIPPITLRTNTLRSTRPELITSLTGEADAVEPTEIAPDGIRLRTPKRAVHEMAAFRRGWFQVQDEAAQLVTLLLPLQPGIAVLDACAGLGGKTGHIAQIMNNQGPLVALDNSESRLNRLARQMRRMGFENVRTAVRDLTDASHIDDFGRFDRVMLDAPCSGLGVLRRNPDAKWKIGEAMLKRYSQIQSTLLENLARLVNPQGYLVYAVCSSEPEEGKQIVDRFVSRHPEFCIDDPSGRLPNQAQSLVAPDQTFATERCLDVMDGFFAACLRRTV